MLSTKVFFVQRRGFLGLESFHLTLIHRTLNKYNPAQQTSVIKDLVIYGYRKLLDEGLFSGV